MRLTRSRYGFIVALLKSQHEIARVELAIAIPIAVGPVGILRHIVFVLAYLKDLDKVS
jgi:hypothetical protein